MIMTLVLCGACDYAGDDQCKNGEAGRGDYVRMVSMSFVMMPIRRRMTKLNSGDDDNVDHDDFDGYTGGHTVDADDNHVNCDCGNCESCAYE